MANDLRSFIQGFGGAALQNQQQQRQQQAQMQQLMMQLQLKAMFDRQAQAQDPLADLRRQKLQAEVNQLTGQGGGNIADTIRQIQEAFGGGGGGAPQAPLQQRQDPLTRFSPQQLSQALGGRNVTGEMRQPAIPQAGASQAGQFRLKPTFKIGKGGQLESVSVAQVETEESKSARKLANARALEEIKRDFQLRKPLSGETAIRVAGAKQGLRNIQQLKTLFGLTRDKSGKTVIGKNFLLNKLGFKAADFQEPEIFGIPVALNVTEVIAQLGAGTTARKIDLAFNTLAENVLRARTGAQAPEPEQVREEKRSLARILDDPESALSRLEENEFFLSEVVNAIRPGSVQRSVTQSQIQQNQPLQIFSVERVQ